MSTRNCPRCKSLLMADAQFCSRCGLRLPEMTEPVNTTAAQPVNIERTPAEGIKDPNLLDVDVIEPFDFQSLVSRGEAFDATETGTTFLKSGNVFTEAESAFLAQAPQTAASIPTTALQLPEDEVMPAVMPGHDAQVQASPPVAAAASLDAQPSIPLTPYVPEYSERPAPSAEPPRFTGPLNSPATPQGALDLLPQEEVIQQLGALYLTNKRVILLAPSVIRSAFVRDIDAVGTMIERAPLWQAILGGVLIGLAAAAVYAQTAREALEPNIGWAFLIDPIITGVVLAAVGIFLLVRYFLWVKRSLFVSVKGRPLITVSMTDWNAAQMAGMDSFVNAFFQVKDFQSGDLVERQIE